MGWDGVGWDRDGGGRGGHDKMRPDPRPAALPSPRAAFAGRAGFKPEQGAGRRSEPPCCAKIFRMQ